MQRHDHALLSTSLGTQRVVSSFHYGQALAGYPKVYIQASLHAEEIPGMLVAHLLKQTLLEAEQAGRLPGSVVLVPAANPIGLAQRLDYKAMGRFELGSSENFNRHYPDLAQAIAAHVAPQLGSDAAANVRTIRAAVGHYLQQWQPTTELDSLRKTLVGLAYDADVVLDMHCDWEATPHLYTLNSCWPTIAPLAQLLQAKTVLVTDEGEHSFEECFSWVWTVLHRQLHTPERPIPQACASTTLELRGEGDVNYPYAQHDAQAIAAYLAHLGVLQTSDPLTLPAPACQATPLAGSQSLRAPHAGVVVFLHQPGEFIRVGEAVAHIVNPIDDLTTPVCAEVEGVFYARIKDRYVHAHCEIGRIAGALPFKTGPLLGV
ncbi:succinylglutamate desuccinylase/aspartoacylase family protein [Curvibacter sp. CHRR-16]|uniref:succinylglutamate desuccinylase/aspartoacylase family protein n=1 Tax=Curvibacter sp. CHRR-16 TaxID=2835872 RepID=UPI001BDA389C|nr:succinylglutamate desuccinylase/aspartoacylase family protein [Curvibacter sp. CHRR-16]MBT0571245.1 succinylglutamate desuccinylase/aspartoacylase family protein [Curvibacter sp. CHRR-16]